MNEINLILNSNIENIDVNILKNDKQLFFEELNKELHLVYSKEYVNYNITLEKLNSYINLDDYIYFLDSLKLINVGDSLFSKKNIIKKMIELFNPIVENLTNIEYNNKNIINKSSLYINYDINARDINNNNIIIPKFKIFDIKGLYNTKTIKYHVPYNFSKFTYYINNQLNNASNKIYYKPLSYENMCVFSFNKVESFKLEKLYNIMLKRFNIILNNQEIYHNTIYNIEKFNPDNIDKYTKFDNKSKENIDIYNTFLNYKIDNTFNNNSYYSFYNNNLLHLYEDIKIYSIDNVNILNKIESIKEYNKSSIDYKLQLKKIENEKFLYNKLEYTTKKKFPNLFNPNSKECIFNIYNKFDINKIPLKMKNIILLEMKKNDNYIKDYLYNKCYHKILVKKFNEADNKYEYYKELLKLVDRKNINDNTLYKCNLCEFNLICPHIIEYYSLYYSQKYDDNKNDIVHNIILNKFMSNAPVNLIYYCKICSEELGKSVDIEQLAYSNKDSYSTESDIDIIKKGIISIIYNYVKFNNINIKLSKFELINYIYDLIHPYINNIEKKIRKNKNIINIDKIIIFNTIIMTMAVLVYIMNIHPNITFIEINSKNSKLKNLANYIVKKGSKQNTKLRDNFIIAYNIIINRYYNLLKELNYLNNLENIKELLVKSYNIINNEKIDSISIEYKNNNNTIPLVLNSSIYSYLYDIACTYPLLKISSNLNDKYQKTLKYTLGFDNNFISSNKNIEFDNINKILNINIQTNKDDIFEKFIIPSKNDNKNTTFDIIKNIDKINTYDNYKYYSFILFSYYIKKRLFERPIFKAEKTDNEYILFLEKSNLIKEFERTIINKNIQYNLYPYSCSKLNNIRYYLEKGINLNIYICDETGQLHIYNQYIFIKDNKEYIYNKKDLDNNINDISKSKFIDYKCSKCDKQQNDIKKIKEYNNISIENIINTKNAINNFYNIYRYKCPIDKYHKFNEKYICNYCKISFNDIINENIEIFYKYEKNYKEYMDTLLLKQNIIIQKIKEKTDNNYNIDVIKFYKDNTQVNSNNIDIYLKKIDNLILDDLKIKISKISNINIKYCNILGFSEGYDYDSISENNINYDNIDNIFIKISNHIRTLNIYYNLLKNCNKIYKYYNLELQDILEEIRNNDINNKFINSLENNKYNLSNVFNFIKIINNDNKYIIDIGLKILFSFIIYINDISIKNNNILDKFILYITKKIFITEELFSNYNYAQLKQVFIQDSIDFDYDTYEDDDDYEDDEESNNLFEYSNLSIEDDD